MILALLPPATKLGQSNIFRSVFQEFCPRGWGVRGRGTCMAGGVRGEGACMAGWHTCPPSPGIYYEIWSMSGRYASYWNAFLLTNVQRKTMAVPWVPPSLE